MAGKCPKRLPEKKRDKLPISIDNTEHFARKVFENMALNPRRNETKNGAFKTKITLGPASAKWIFDAEIEKLRTEIFLHVKKTKIMLGKQE